MALSSEEIIVPRRDELISYKGERATQRFMKYFESLAKKVNETGDYVNAITYEINSATHTTAGDEHLLCQVACVITLNLTPVDQETVTVTRLAGQVQVLGNTRKVFSTAYDDVIINTQGTSLTFFYSTATDMWHLL